MRRKNPHQGGHATARFLEGFLEGSLKEVLLRRVLRRRLVRASVRTGVLRRVLRRERRIEGAQKVLRRQKHALSQSTTPFACTLKEFPQRGRNVRISFAKNSHSLAKSFATLNSQLFVCDLVVKIASEVSGRVRIRIRIRSCIAATAVHSGPDLFQPRRR